MLDILKDMVANIGNSGKDQVVLMVSQEVVDRGDEYQRLKSEGNQPKEESREEE